MVKFAVALTVTVLGLALAAPAGAGIIGFSGPWAPGTWTTTIVGDVNPPGSTNDGSVNTAGAPASITIIGGDDPAGLGCLNGFLNCEIRFTHPGTGATIGFNWLYASTDSAGAQLDQFGVIVDGIHVNISDPGGSANQSGFRSFTPLTSFGFFINCGDCIGGNATTSISNFAVPEPATLGLLGLGLAALGIRRKTRA